MNSQFSLMLSLRTFIILTSIFILHRAMALSFLAAHVRDTKHLLRTFLVGAMSDIWIAAIGSVIVLAVTFLMRKKFLSLAFFFAFIAILLTATAGHQAYVMFFHHPMLLAHLEYLYDFEFIQANGGSFANIYTWSLIATGFILTYLLHRKDVFAQYSWKVTAAALTLIILVAASAHSGNLILRHNWFVPQNLQANGLEHLYIAFSHRHHHDSLEPQELRRLVQLLPVSQSVSTETSVEMLAGTEPALPDDTIEHLLTAWHHSEADINATGHALKNQWQLDIKHRKKPVLLLLTLESMRAADSGYIYSNLAPHRPSITPHLDHLASSGIVFTNAYSNSVVTRGAQEALLCGYPGNQNASLMRTFSHWQYTCLFDAVKDQPSPGTTFWLHGGEGLFDNQQVFWTKHHTDHILTKADFAPDAPQTGWGVSDKTFMELSVRKLKQIHDTSIHYSVGMMLSLSNHPPWDLPSDAVIGPEFENLAAHHKTTVYADAAVGRLIESLKESGLWEHSLVFVVGDHGHSLEPYYHSGESQAWSDGALKTQVPFIISGGIAERATAAVPQVELRQESYVNHLDIASFVAWLLDIKHFASFGEGLFLQSSRQPKFAEVGSGVYFPSLKKFYSYQNITRENKEGGEDPSVHIHKQYFRAFLDWVSSRQQKVVYQAAAKKSK